jgi:hypothetical protein
MFRIFSSPWVYIYGHMLAGLPLKLAVHLQLSGESRLTESILTKHQYLGCIEVNSLAKYLWGFNVKLIYMLPIAVQHLFAA